MTKQQRAEILEAFKWAKTYLSHSRIVAHIHENRFICNAIDMAGGWVNPGAPAAKAIISRRLSGFGTYEDWVVRKVGVSVYEKDKDHNQGRKCQAGRHAWLDSLIEEFSP